MLSLFSSKIANEMNGATADGVIHLAKHNIHELKSYNGNVHLSNHLNKIAIYEKHRQLCHASSSQKLKSNRKPIYD